MTIILLLLLTSALLGLATGGYFRVWALLLVSPLIAILAAIVLRSYDFGVAAGVPVIVGCLVVSQTAYMAMTFYRYREKLSVQDEIDGAPSEDGEQDVRDQNE